MAATNTTQWVWVGSSRRHTLKLEHNTISGAQTITFNGAPLFSSGWRFKLTGTIHIPTDDSNLELYLLADGAGVLAKLFATAPTSLSLILPHTLLCLCAPPHANTKQSGARCPTSSL